MWVETAFKALIIKILPGASSLFSGLFFVDSNTSALAIDYQVITDFGL
jgi:hypothetical protein